MKYYCIFLMLGNPDLYENDALLLLWVTNNWINWNINLVLKFFFILFLRMVQTFLIVTSVSQIHIYTIYVYTSSQNVVLLINLFNTLDPALIRSLVVMLVLIYSYCGQVHPAYKLSLPLHFLVLEQNCRHCWWLCLIFRKKITTYFWD